MCALLVSATAAHAGRPCDETPPRVAEVERGFVLAQAVAQRLDAGGAQVVALARAGQDLSKYGLAWSHFGFAYRDGDGAKSYWRVVHKLNHCGSDDAALYRQGLAEFFLDRPQRYEAAIVELSADAQAKLLPLLRHDARAALLHERRYSLVAYPWATRYQQSNQWAIETLAAAMEPAVGSSRVRAQAWLKFQGYQPSTLRIDALTRLGGRMTRANVAFDDHPNAKRFADRIETVTVDSVFAWLQRSGLGSAPVVVR